MQGVNHLGLRDAVFLGEVLTEWHVYGATPDSLGADFPWSLFY